MGEIIKGDFTTEKVKPENADTRTVNNKELIININDGIVDVAKERIKRYFEIRDIPLPEEKRLNEMARIISGVPLSDNL